MNFFGKNASAGNRTRVNCLEGSYANHYTTDASVNRVLEITNSQFLMRFDNLFHSISHTTKQLFSYN